MDDRTASRRQTAGVHRPLRRFVAILDSIGPFDYSVGKTLITMKGVRRGFAGAKPTGSGLTGYFDVQRVIDDPRIRSVSPYTKRLFVHHFTLTELCQLDDRFAGWLHEAYAVGAGEHMR